MCDTHLMEICAWRNRKVALQNYCTLGGSTFGSRRQKTKEALLKDLNYLQFSDTELSPFVFKLLTPYKTQKQKLMEAIGLEMNTFVLASIEFKVESDNCVNSFGSFLRHYYCPLRIKSSEQIKITPVAICGNYSDLQRHNFCPY